jgi:hypothetical protein
MTREQIIKHNSKTIKALCAEHGCSDKLRKIHYDQMVHRAWNPHPSQEFVEWWKTQPEYGDGVGAVKARNCRVFCDRYKQAVADGVASFPIDHPASTR